MNTVDIPNKTSTNRKTMRIFILEDYTSRTVTKEAIIRALSPFVNVGSFQRHYRLIANRGRYAFFKIPYRAIEFLYWILLTFKNIREIGADMVVVMYVYSTGFVGTLAALLARKPCVLVAVGSDLRINTQTSIGKCVISWTVRNASGVVCVSKDLENIARRLGARDTIVIPPSIDVPQCERGNLKTNVVISVASLNPVKGISYLVRAMKHLNNAQLTIIGEGPERKELEALSSKLGLIDRVSFLGWVDHGPRFWKHLQEARVFVLPSISEGLPRALIEAMACGLPVVATRIGGIPEVVTDGINGFLVSPRNEKQLAEAIRRILNDDSFCRKASIANRQAAKRYSPETVGQEMFNYLISHNRA